MLRMLVKEAKADWKTALVVASIDPNVILVLNIAHPQSSSLELLLRVKELFDIPVFLLRSKGTEGFKVEEVVTQRQDNGSGSYNNKNLAEPVQTLLERLELRLGDGASQCRVGELFINFTNHRVTLQGKPVPLTGTEYELLACLAHSPGRVISHQILCASLWGCSQSANDYNLRAYIKRLRRKLGAGGGGRKYIQSVYGRGYRLADTRSLHPLRKTKGRRGPISQGASAQGASKGPLC